MDLFQIGLTLAILLCSLVAGLVFTFAVVTMPGIGTLNDREFLRAFQVMDRVIQNNQPVFMLVWVGSVISLVATCLIGFRQVTGTEQMLLVAAAAVYLLGVQLPTVVVNVPLNNQVQALDVTELDEQTLAAAREDFEAPWTRWNTIRTVLACLAVAMLIVLALRL